MRDLLMLLIVLIFTTSGAGECANAASWVPTMKQTTAVSNAYIVLASVFWVAFSDTCYSSVLGIGQRQTCRKYRSF
jgi:hypothetical protein